MTLTARKARQFIAAARAKGRDALTEVEAKNVFKATVCLSPPTALAHSEEEAIPAG